MTWKRIFWNIIRGGWKSLFKKEKILGKILQVIKSEHFKWGGFLGLIQTISGGWIELKLKVLGKGQNSIRSVGSLNVNIKDNTMVIIIKFSIW